MSVAIVTDSGSDLTASQLADYGIRQVPLVVSFGDHGYKSPDELDSDEFWRRLSTAGSPFPSTAAPSPGAFRSAFEDALREPGVTAIVYVGISDTLSATLRSGQIAAGQMDGAEIHVVDSRSASMGVGALAIMGARMARDGRAGADIAAELTKLRDRTKFFVALETLEFLRRGGRISGARAAIGGLLSIKPIMTISEGLVVPLDQPRTRAKARERLIEVMTDRPAIGLHVMYAPPFDAEALCRDLVARLPDPKPAPENVSAQVIGPVIGTHVGPGAYGGVLVYAE